MDSAFMEQDEPEHHASYSQSVMTNDFQFQQSLAVHQGCVRSLGTLETGYLLAGSIDKSSKLFVLNNRSGKYDFEKEMTYHDGFVYSICS